MSLRYGEMCNAYVVEICAEPSSEKILKIDQYFAKLST